MLLGLLGEKIKAMDRHTGFARCDCSEYEYLFRILYRVVSLYVVYDAAGYLGGRIVCVGVRVLGLPLDLAAFRVDPLGSRSCIAAYLVAASSKRSLWQLLAWQY